MKLKKMEERVRKKLEYDVLEFHSDGEAFSAKVEDAGMISIECEGPWQGEGDDGEDIIDHNSICYFIHLASDFKKTGFRNELEFEVDNFDVIYAWVDVKKQFVEFVLNFEEDEWNNIIMNLYSYFEKYDSFDVIE